MDGAGPWRDYVFKRPRRIEYPCVILVRDRIENVAWLNLTRQPKGLYVMCDRSRATGAPAQVGYEFCARKVMSCCYFKTLTSAESNELRVIKNESNPLPKWQPPWQPTLFEYRKQGVEQGTFRR